MDRQATLLQLAQKLSAATASSDWKALAAIDTLLGSALPKMAAQGKWTPAERAALDALRALHKTALARVNDATAELDKHLYDLKNNREGWMAYALDNEVSGTHA
ncbi:hypothetical protein [Pseudoduganella sp. RAF53_2]|uniref:hypothetical protein n=1 Tax=unclassified Pseudoduganella TaxID=2637179 RepID=UPI003F9D98F8